MAGRNSLDWTNLEMCKTVTDSWKEFAGLDKPADVQDSNIQLEGIRWTGQTWRCDINRGLDRIHWTGQTWRCDTNRGLDKPGDVQDSNRQLEGIWWTGQTWRCARQ